MTGSKAGSKTGSKAGSKAGSGLEAIARSFETGAEDASAERSCTVCADIEASGRGGSTGIGGRCGVNR